MTVRARQRPRCMALLPKAGRDATYDVARGHAAHNTVLRPRCTPMLGSPLPHLYWDKAGPPFQAPEHTRVHAHRHRHRHRHAAPTCAARLRVAQLRAGLNARLAAASQVVLACMQHIRGNGYNIYHAIGPRLPCMSSSSNTPPRYLQHARSDEADPKRPPTRLPPCASSYRIRRAFRLLVGSRMRKGCRVRSIQRREEGSGMLYEGSAHEPHHCPLRRGCTRGTRRL
jgi:hypothetical protein